VRVLGDRDPEVAEDQEHEPDVHHRAQGQRRVDGERSDHKRHGNGEHTWEPVHGRRQHHRSRVREDQVRHVAGHEEREGVHQSEDAQPSSRAAENLGGEPASVLASGRHDRVTRTQESFAGGVRRHVESARLKSTPAFMPCTLSILESSGDCVIAAFSRAVGHWR